WAPRMTVRWSRSPTAASASLLRCCRASSSPSPRATAPSSGCPAGSASGSPWPDGSWRRTAAPSRRRAAGPGAAAVSWCGCGGPAASQGRGGGGGAAPRRIRLVEDSQHARDMLRMYLAQLGHQVYEAADGPSAVEAALRVLPDVALIDIRPPGVDGYEVARRIRATQDGRHLYLVAVTGYGQPKDRDQALAAGFDDYLVKPFDRDRLA